MHHLRSVLYHSFTQTAGPDMLRNIESLSNVFSLAVLTRRGRIPRNYRAPERYFVLQMLSFSTCFSEFVEFTMRPANRSLNCYSYESKGI